jgi:cholesterol oxidase
MRGFVDATSTDYEAAYVRGKETKNAVDARMTIKVDNVDEFIVVPDHQASIEGWVTSTIGGEKRPIERGVFNLLVDRGDPSKKKMLYRLHFSDDNGNPLTLSGFKDVKDDAGGDVWQDTTTLFTHIYDGHLAADQEDAATPRATGIIRLTFPEFIKELGTFRTEGPTIGDRVAALTRFGALFLGSLWDVYAKKVLTYAPF